MGLRPRNLGRSIRRRDVHRLGKTEHHGIRDLLVRDRISDRVTHLRIIERRYGRGVLENRVLLSVKVTDMSPVFMSSASSGFKLSRS